MRLDLGHVRVARREPELLLSFHYHYYITITIIINADYSVSILKIITAIIIAVNKNNNKLQRADLWAGLRLAMQTENQSTIIIIIIITTIIIIAASRLVGGVALGDADGDGPGEMRQVEHHLPQKGN